MAALMYERPYAPDMRTDHTPQSRGSGCRIIGADHAHGAPRTRRGAAGFCVFFQALSLSGLCADRRARGRPRGSPAHARCTQSGTRLSRVINENVWTVNMTVNMLDVAPRFVQDGGSLHPAVILLGTSSLPCRARARARRAREARATAPPPLQLQQEAGAAVRRAKLRASSCE